MAYENKGDFINAPIIGELIDISEDACPSKFINKKGSKSQQQIEKY